MEDSTTVTAKQYVGRRGDCTVVNMTLDQQAAEVLRHYCPPGRKTTGKFVARLLYEHHAREEERQRLRQAVQSTLGPAMAVTGGDSDEE